MSKYPMKSGPSDSVDLELQAETCESIHTGARNQTQVLTREVYTLIHGAISFYWLVNGIYALSNPYIRGS